jgi:PhnB protein
LPSHFHNDGKQKAKSLTTLSTFPQQHRRPIMAAKPVPDGYHTVTPYLTVRNAAKVIEFLQQAFGAKISHEPTRRPDGSVMHAQVTVGDSPIMIADESEMAKATESTLYLYVPNVDSVYQRAVKAGGNTVMEPADMFYGDRSGAVKDPSGNSWFIATHKEDLAPQELQKRAEAFMKQQKGKAA